MIPFRILSVFELALSPCIAGGKKGAAGGCQPIAAGIIFQSFTNPAGMDLVDAIEGSTASRFSPIAQ